MAGMGKPPSENARHHSPTLDSTSMKLPRSGRPGKAPAWPLDDKPTTSESKAWQQLWKLPQAVAWERLESTRAVARYVVVLVESEKRGAPAALLSEVRQMEDRLGLSPMALLRLRWSIVADELATGADGQKAPAQSARGRLRVVS